MDVDLIKWLIFQFIAGIICLTIFRAILPKNIQLLRKNVIALVLSILFLLSGLALVFNVSKHVYFDYRLSNSIEKFGENHPETISVLLKAVETGLDSEDNIKLLGSTDSNEAIPVLLRSLEAGSSPKQIEAIVTSLAKLNRTESIRPILAITDQYSCTNSRECKNLGVKKQKIQELLSKMISMGGDTAATELYKFVKNDNPKFASSVTASYLLAELDNKESISSLIDLANKSYNYGKRGSIENFKALNAQEIVLENLSKSNRIEARDSLIEIALKGATSDLQEEQSKGSDAVKVLSNIADETTKDALFEIIEVSSNKWILQWVAYSLRSYDDKESHQKLVELSNHSHRQVQWYAIESLGFRGGLNSIKVLISRLNEWDVSQRAAKELEKLDWNPSTAAEKVYWWIATRDSEKLNKNWTQTKGILLNDLKSKSRSKVENAVYSFIGLGRVGTLELLKDALNSNGTVVMAETYLNSGNKTLNETARAWAKIRGYTITTGDGARAVSWKSW